MQQRFYQQFETYFFMKIIVSRIPADLVKNLLFSIFCPSLVTKNKGSNFQQVDDLQQEIFCFLFIASQTLVQSHAEFNRLLERKFVTCYSLLVLQFHAAVTRFILGFTYFLEANQEIIKGSFQKIQHFEHTHDIFLSHNEVQALNRNDQEDIFKQVQGHMSEVTDLIATFLLRFN